jgi:hypothetical protein
MFQAMLAVFKYGNRTLLCRELVVAGQCCAVVTMRKYAAVVPIDLQLTHSWSHQHCDLVTQSNEGAVDKKGRHVWQTLQQVHKQETWPAC